MARAVYQDKRWEDIRLIPYQKLELDPVAKVFHYGQEIFEGMKAYRNQNSGPFLFRPEENFLRFNFSARRMVMPEIPQEYFMEAVYEITARCADFIPRALGDSLYIRPFMFASEEHLGIASSHRFEFLVVASPSRAFFTQNALSIKIEREYVRASHGGVGNAKTGGNYAASLLAMRKAKKEGHDQVLWLDGQERCYIEELSGMNFFAVYGDSLKTPALTDSILDGITRKSLIDLAKHLGHLVTEERMSVDSLIEDIQKGKCTELFACGTAVAVTPIRSLADRGKIYSLKQVKDSLSDKLRKGLLELQQGIGDDPFRWRKAVTVSS